MAAKTATPNHTTRQGENAPAFPEQFSPHAQLGYGLSQDSEFALRDMAKTFEFLGGALDRMPGDVAVDIDSSDIAAMFRTFNRALTGIVDQAPSARIHVVLQ